MQRIIFTFDEGVSGGASMDALEELVGKFCMEVEKDEHHSPPWMKLLRTSIHLSA